MIATKKSRILCLYGVLKQSAFEMKIEECDLITIEGSVFGEWLDELRDDHKAVAIDLKLAWLVQLFQRKIV